MSIKNPLTPAGIEPATFRFIAQHLNHCATAGVDGRIRLRWIFRKWDGDMDWIDLAKDRYRWRALVNGVMNIWFP